MGEDCIHDPFTFTVLFWGWISGTIFSGVFAHSFTWNFGNSFTWKWGGLYTLRKLRRWKRTWKTSKNHHCEVPNAQFPMTDPWDWIIYLPEWLISMVNVGKYTIHGSCGKLNFGGEGDDHIMWYDTLQETITWDPPSTQKYPLVGDILVSRRVSYHITPKSNRYDGILFAQINWKKTSWQGKLEHWDKVCFKYYASLVSDFKKENIAKK